MAQQSAPRFSRDLLAYALPFVLFMAGLMAVSGAKSLGISSFGGITMEPMYWIYPIQSAVCAGALLWFWRSYDFSGTTPVGILIGIAVGAAIFALWVAPQALLHQPPRLEGFDPNAVPVMLPWMLGMRFARLVLVVPLIEELFWRGFLLRYLVREDFTAVAFGTASRTSFWTVAVAFMLVHARADWPAAFITGILLNLVATRTHSLAACVVAHATANLALGVYICATRQWGFW